MLSIKNVITLSGMAMGLLFTFSVQSQNIKDSAKNQVSVSVNYQSTLHYFGRVDSLRSSGVFPIISLKRKTGLYLNSTFIFIQNQVTSLNYTGTILEGGYKFPYSKNFSGNIYYDYFLYEDKSVLQQAALKGQTGINTAYNSKIVNVNIGGDVKFSNNQIDYGATAGLDKLILFRKLINKVVVAVNPSAYIYAGTHNYFRSVKSTTIFGLPSNSTTLQQSKQFTILAYEFSAPVVVVKGKFNAYISSAYTIPQHLLIVTGRPDLTEKGENLFYFSAGIGVTL